MGGMGSGRQKYATSDTISGYHALDVRWLKRKGMLSPGATRRITWACQGDVAVAINIRVEPERVFLIYRRRNGDDWKNECYPVHLVTTPCHVGGERPWFLCPARGCGQRVAVLFGGGIFACRKCHKLAYASQRENEIDRGIRRADRIRERLKWSDGTSGWSPWEKPKGMHQRTYERLSQEHDVFAIAVNEAVISRCGGLWTKAGPIRAKKVRNGSAT